MQPKFTIIYAFRNRDANRIKLSLASLVNQKKRNFEVQFVDYGSERKYAKAVEEVLKEFSFANYHYIAHEGLLWNKSKAINYGILKAKGSAIFIADADVLFAVNFSEIIESLIKQDQFLLFKIGYLEESVTPKVIENSNFETLKPKHYGDTFGVGLFPKIALEKIGGLDEFFHFYGSEDEDLNSRLITAGYKMNRCEENILLHQWHKRYPQKTKEKLTVIPRLSNIRRINQRHFLRRKEQHGFVLDKIQDRKYYTKSDYEIFETPTNIIEVDNIEAKVIHVLNYELPLIKNGITKMIFKQSPYYKSSKYKIKTALNKLTQAYLSMKQVNDLILQKILFNYRDYNYKYEVSKDLKTIEFIVDLRN